MNAPSAKERPAGRRYLEIRELSLMAPIPSPKDAIQREGYGYQHFKFFVEAGFICIECRATGRIEEVPPSMIKRMRRLTDAEKADIVTKAAVEASSP